MGLNSQVAGHPVMDDVPRRMPDLVRQCDFLM